MLIAKLYLHIFAAMFFCVLTLGMTFPLILHLDTHITPGLQPAMTVPYLNLWTLAWNYHWLQGKAANYWDANQFFPHQKTLAYSEPQLGTALFTFPIVLFGGTTVMAYNITLLLFFWGAGVAVYALCWWVLGLVSERRETDRCIASITAGVLYAFTPYMFRELGVLQLLSILFPPVCLLGLHRFFNKKRLSDAILFTAGFLGCWYSCAYYGLFLSVFVGCFPFLFWHRDLFRWRYLLRGLVAISILVVSLLPLAYGMHTAKVALSLDRSQETVRALSGVFRGYFQFPSSSLLYEQILGIGSPEGSLFLGGMLLCLACVGTLSLLRSQILVGNAETVNITPPARDQLRLPSMPQYSIFYITMACLAFILSLGMALTPIHTKGLGLYRIITWLSPYNLLYKFVPGFSSIRSPYRFSIFLVLFLSILAGVGMLWVCQRFRSRWRWAVIVCVISVTIFELLPVSVQLVKVPSTLAELPRIYQHVKKLPSDAVLIELPLPTSGSEREMEATVRYIYFSTFHWQRLVNGYSGFAPKAESELIEIFAKSDPKTVLSALKAFGVEYVVAHWKDMSAEEELLLRTLESDSSLKPMYRDGNNHTLYEIREDEHRNSPPVFPKVERLAIYESGEQSSSVTVCFYYAMCRDQVLLVTPWWHSIKCEVSWYKKSTETRGGVGEPVLIENVYYQGSKLLYADSNALAMQVYAPDPGKYQVIVKHRLASGLVTKTGVCEITPHGFVQFREEP